MSFGPLPRDVGPRFIDIGPERSIATLSTIEAGWRRVVEAAEVDARSGEVEITECLREGMRTVLKECKRAEPWRKRMTVLPGTESRSAPAVVKPDGRTDIPIFFQEIRETYDDHDPHAIIECKRVAGNDPLLCRLYVGKGIDRFTSAKYSGRHKVAFMAGYVIAGGVDAAIRRINRYLSNGGRGAEVLARCTVLAAGWARSSRHLRQPPASPIDLHHAFLTFQTAS